MAASDGHPRGADDGERGIVVGGDVDRMLSVEEEATAEDDETRVVCSVEVVDAAVVDAAVVDVEVVGTPVVVFSHAVAPAPLVLPAGHAAQSFDLAALYFPAVQIVHTAAAPTE